ncbi:synaptotagmin-like protein 2 [Tiliqua scincoides]|uniref:synaptotagmin-like protein 2 n=1 Tax=Tiliqua scincoides TaxID=71010 RepID=UPI00346256A1
MIDLSFLTDEEQEAILKVLQRDADLKRAEEDRVRHLPEKIKDDSQIKNMSGQWFYEAKAKRHRERIHGADLIRASIRRKPMTTAEPNRSKSGEVKNSWVNNINKEANMPPQVFRAIEEESKSSQSSKEFNAASDILDKPQEDTRKMAASPSKQRKNPFNDSALPDDNKLPENAMTDLSEASKKDTLLPSVESPSKVKFTSDHRVEESQKAFIEPKELQRQAGKPPIPKARKNIHKTSDVSLKSDDSFPKAPGRVKQINGQGIPPRGILKRSPSSSSTDSEVLRLSQAFDPPSKSVLEGVAEKNPPAGESEGFSQNSLERLKQVRFSSNVGRKERPQSLELHEGKESGEFSFIDSDYVKTSENQVGGLDALQNEPGKPSYSDSPVLNGNTEDRGVSHKGEMASSSYRSDLPSSDLLCEKSPIVEPTTPEKSSSKISSNVSEKQTLDEAHPQVKTQQLSPGPDLSKNTTGQQLPLAKPEDPQVPSPGSSNLEQGKPDLVEGQSAKTSSRSDKHAAEVLKAADESISKVLDWFQRSSSTDSTDTLSLMTQGRESAEEVDVPKIKEDDESSTDMLNLHSSLCEKEEWTSKDVQAHERVSPPEKFSLAKNSSPGSQLLEEQRLCSEIKVKGVVDSGDEGESIIDRPRTCFQTTDQESHTRTSTTNQHDTSKNAHREPKAFEDSKIQLGLKSVDSSIKVMERKNSPKAFVDGEGGVKSFVVKGNFEYQAQMPLKEAEEEKESKSLNEGTKPDDTDLLLLQQQDLKQPSPSRDQKRVKDIWAFWESARTTPKLPDHGQRLNDSTPVSDVKQSSTKRSSTMKPLGGSSGYATAESDNEQGKYSLVTFRKVQLSDDDSEATDNDSKLSLGKTAPGLVDKFKGSHVDKTSKMPPNNIKSAKRLGSNNLPSRRSAGFSSQEDGDLQAIDLEKEWTPSALQQKHKFEIHSLKEKTDEESKAQGLDPSRFQSLRSFWDVGTRPQNETEAAKTKRVIPSSNIRMGSSWKDSKELKGIPVGMDQVVLEGEQQNWMIQEDREKQSNAKMLSQREESRTVPKEVGQPFLSPTTQSVPMENLELALTEDNSLEKPGMSKVEGKMMLPVEEYFEKTVAPSRIQHGMFSNGLQKMMKEAYRESLPANLPSDKKRASNVEELIYHGRSNQTAQHGAIPADTGRNTEFSANEVVETVNRTLILPKSDTDAFNATLGRLLKEAKPSSSHLIVKDASEQEVSPSDRMRFFNKVMERSHDVYPSDHKKSGVVFQETRQKYVSSVDQPIEFKPGLGNLSRETEDSNSVPGEASKGQIYPDDDPVQKRAFQIPSPSPILSDAQLAADGNRARYPGKEVSEVVTETNVPSKRECHDLNAKLVILLKESPRMPCISPANEKIMKAPLPSIPGEDQQRSYRQVTKNSAPASPQMANLPRETISEQTNEVVETVVKTVKPNSLEHTTFKNNLSKLLKEDYQVLFKGTEIPKSMHPSLQADQSECSVFHRDTPSPQEIDEIVEKERAPSNFRYGDLKANLEKLFKPDSEIVLFSQKSADDSNEGCVGTEPNRIVDLACQEKMSPGKEIHETVIRNVAPSKLKGSEFNSGLRKLLEEASQVPSVQLEPLDATMKEKMQTSPGVETAVVLPQEANEIVVKSIAPAKDAATFKFSLGKLIKESSDASLQLSQESQKVLKDSAFLLEKKSLPVNTPAPVESVSSGYRTEVKIPLKGKTLKQDEQAMEIGTFQKTLQVKPASTEALLLGEKDSSPILARVDAKESQYERKAEEVSRASTFLDDGHEEVSVAFGSQKSSTPIAEKKNTSKINEAELQSASCSAADGVDEEDEDAKSFGSDISEENLGSFAGIQRSSACSEEEPNPVLEALKRSSNRQTPSKSLEDIPSATSNKGKVNLPKEDLMLSAEDGQDADQTNENVPGVSTAPSFPDNQFSHPEKVKQMSKSVPAFLQDESDRETDSASDSSYPLGRIKKSPSSLTNLSGSSGLASLSSVSTSVMSIYSGDFGNVDVKGNVQFAIDYVEQLKELHIFIAQCKDLAIGDVKKQRSDPYVKCYLLPEKYKLGKRKTSVKKKTLNPVFNEILRYKIDKTLLVYQRLNVSVWHNDIFGRNSFLGEVELDLGSWDWDDRQNKQMNWYPLKPRTPLDALELENRGEMKLALQYVPVPLGSKKTPATGEVHIWVKQCNDLPIIRGNRLNSFVKCTILPDTSRKSCQKTRAVAKTTNPVFNHTMVYDGFRPEDLKEACVELTVWDHNKLVNRFLGGLRIGLGIGKSYGTAVDWMDSTLDEISLWERMINSPNKWVEDTLPLRMLTIAKMAK